MCSTNACPAASSHLLYVGVALGAGFEELDAKLIGQRLTLAEGHHALVLVHITFVAHQDLQKGPRADGFTETSSPSDYVRSQDITSHRI